MFFYIIYAIVVFAGLAMLVREGLWSNAITLVNILLSGLLAFGFYSPVVIYLDELADGEHTYWLDFVILWALFCASMVVCRAFTGAASKTRMRFKNPIDPVGGPLAALIAAWVLAAFVTATLHTSPMPKDAFGGKLVGPAEVKTASAYASPDAAWLRLVERASAPSAFGSGSTDRFRAEGFVKIYQHKRAKFEAAPGMVVSRG
jgi:hypothetical protein